MYVYVVVFRCSLNCMRSEKSLWRHVQVLSGIYKNTLWIYEYTRMYYAWVIFFTQNVFFGKNKRKHKTHKKSKIELKNTVVQHIFRKCRILVGVYLVELRNAILCTYLLKQYASTWCICCLNLLVFCNLVCYLVCYTIRYLLFHLNSYLT
jgi:hypothetical protein